MRTSPVRGATVVGTVLEVFEEPAATPELLRMRVVASVEQTSPAHSQSSGWMTAKPLTEAAKLSWWTCPGRQLDAPGRRRPTTRDVFPDRRTSGSHAHLTTLPVPKTPPTRKAGNF
jgi:hypothetical protein